MRGVTQLTLFPMQEEEFPRADICPRDTRKWNAFMRFHKSHPEVYDFFCNAAVQARMKGYSKIGARLLIERVRWECYIERKRENYKINNNNFPFYARIFVLNHPEYDGFFEFRKLKE